MCKSKSSGGRRCPTHASGTQAIAYEAEREYGLTESVFRKVIGIFRKEAYHNGISDKIDASAEAVKNFISERKEAIKRAVNMSDAEKRTALRRWARAAKEKISMATLYSWKKASAIMVAGSMAVVLSACVNSGESTENLPSDPATPVVEQTEEPTGENVEAPAPPSNEDLGAFGYDFSTIPVPDDVKERYGEEAAGNLVNDTYAPMEVMKSSKDLYAPGEKTQTTYFPLKPYLTPKAWETAVNDLESEDGVPHVFVGYAVGCNDDGETAIVKEGAEPDSNEDSYEMMKCDELQDLSTFKIDNVTVGTEQIRNAPQMTDVPEHVRVASTTSQTVTGTLPDGTRASQEHIYDLQIYMIPDPEKENHWLVDGVNWQHTHGETKRNN